MKSKDINSQYTAVDAEIAVLGALLLERGAFDNVKYILSKESFYKEAHQKIYLAVLELFDRSEPVDLITVVNHLRSKAELEFVGGAYYITELTTKVSSAANIQYHAYIIQEAAIRRNVYTAFRALLDKSKDSDIHNLIEKATTLINDLNGITYKKNTDTVFLERLNSLLFNHEIIIPDPVPVISISGGLISSSGNITYIKGPSKSGKSGILNAIISGAISKDGFCPDTCGISIAENTYKKLVLHVDTEQSSSNHYKSNRTILRRCGITIPPKFFLSILLRELSIEERIKALEILLEKYAAEFGGVHLIIIDGIADFVSSVNDEEESNNIVALFEKLAIKYSCPIITIAHLNPSSDTKGRGHLDSQLERKSESVLTIKMDKDTKISTLSCTYLRNAGNIPDLEFYYDTEKGYHVYSGNAPTKEELKRTELGLQAVLLFDKGRCKYTYSELVNEIKNTYAISDRSAKSKIALMKESKLIDNEPFRGGKYYLMQ